MVLLEHAVPLEPEGVFSHVNYKCLVGSLINSNTRVQIHHLTHVWAREVSTAWMSALSRYRSYCHIMVFKDDTHMKYANTSILNLALTWHAPDSKSLRAVWRTSLISSLLMLQLMYERTSSSSSLDIDFFLDCICLRLHLKSSTPPLSFRLSSRNCTSLCTLASTQSRVITTDWEPRILCVYTVRV